MKLQNPVQVETRQGLKARANKATTEKRSKGNSDMKAKQNKVTNSR